MTTPHDDCTELRARHVRCVNLLRRLCGDIDHLEDDEYHADWDQAVAAAKRLLAEEDALLERPAD